MNADELYVPAQLANPLEIGLEKHARQWERVLDWMVEPKLDGIRACVVKGHGAVRVYTRTKHDITERLPVGLVAELERSLPPDSVLDGELGYEGGVWKELSYNWPIIDFNRTVRVTGSMPIEAQRKIHDNLLAGHVFNFYAFDILRWRGEYLGSQANLVRREMLDTLFPESYVYLEIVDWTRWWAESTYVEYVKAGGEGVMLKNPKADYFPGTRATQVWYKVKAFDTMDVVITGYKPGQGKYIGQVGALTCTTPQGVVIHVSGMSDEERAKFTSRFNHPSQGIVGCHIEVRFFGKVGKEGKGIRHPQFIRMRPDLDD